jgi:hypothetical protein
VDAGIGRIVLADGDRTYPKEPARGSWPPPAGRLRIPIPDLEYGGGGLSASMAEPQLVPTQG